VKSLISSKAVIMFKKYNDLSLDTKEFINIIYKNKTLSDKDELRYNINKEGDKDV